MYIEVKQKTNDYLKSISKICKLPKVLSSHCARKTFGHLMHNEYNVPIETVSRMLGHKSIRTTQSWYVRTGMKKIMRDMEPVARLLQGA